MLYCLLFNYILKTTSLWIFSLQRQTTLIPLMYMFYHKLNLIHLSQVPSIPANSLVILMRILMENIFFHLWSWQDCENTTVGLILSMGKSWWFWICLQLSWYFWNRILKIWKTIRNTCPEFADYGRLKKSMKCQLYSQFF